jgi:hypothetical protein
LKAKELVNPDYTKYSVLVTVHPTSGHVVLKVGVIPIIIIIIIIIRENLDKNTGMNMCHNQ